MTIGGWIVFGFSSLAIVMFGAMVASYADSIIAKVSV